MIVGFLRQGSLYRAPCRWYPDGPIGEIEYYYAEPDAKWYDGTQIFFPLNFFKGSVNTGVGELTDQGPRDFRQQRLTPPCPGQWAVGTVEDFNGETPYPGEATIDTLPDCEHEPPPPPPTPGIDPHAIRIQIDGMVVQSIDEIQTFNGDWVMGYHDGVDYYSGQEPPGGFVGLARKGVNNVERPRFGFDLTMTRTFLAGKPGLFELYWELDGSIREPFDVTFRPSIKVSDDIWAERVPAPERLIDAGRLRVTPIWYY